MKIDLITVIEATSIGLILVFAWIVWPPLTLAVAGVAGLAYSAGNQ